MRTILILIWAILTMSEESFGQYRYNLNMFEPEIVDARAEALGRSSILSSTGANYIFNNPAMLCNLSQANIQLFIRSIYGKSEINEKGGIKTTKTDYEYPFHIKLNGLSFGMPYSIPKYKDFQLGFGIGYRTYYDNGFNMDGSTNSTYDDSKIKTKSHGGNSTLVLGGGFGYKNIFFGGISLSLPFFSNFSYENHHQYKSKGTMNSTFFTLSTSYVLNKKVTFGARLRTAFSLEYNIKFNEYEYESNEFESEAEIPYELGVSIELKPFYSVKFYAEYLTRFFGDFKQDNNYLYKNSNNGYSFRSGIEVGAKTLFRGGFFMQSVPLYKKITSDDTKKENKPQTEIGFTTGLGISINKKLTLDFFGAYTILNYDEKYKYYSEQHSNDYSHTRIKMGFSVGYNF